MVNCKVHKFIDLVKAYVMGNANLESTESKIQKKYQGCLAVLMIFVGVIHNRCTSSTVE